MSQLVQKLVCTNLHDLYMSAPGHRLDHLWYFDVTQIAHLCVWRQAGWR